MPTAPCSPTSTARATSRTVSRAFSLVLFNRLPDSRLGSHEITIGVGQISVEAQRGLPDASSTSHFDPQIDPQKSDSVKGLSDPDATRLSVVLLRAWVCLEPLRDSGLWLSCPTHTAVPLSILHKHAQQARGTRRSSTSTLATRGSKCGTLGTRGSVSASAGISGSQRRPGVLPSKAQRSSSSPRPSAQSPRTLQSTLSPTGPTPCRCVRVCVCVCRRVLLS